VSATGAVRASESRGTETTFLLLFYVFPNRTL
jgi:hypothetical protein